MGKSFLILQHIPFQPPSERNVWQFLNSFSIYNIKKNGVCVCVGGGVGVTVVFKIMDWSKSLCGQKSDGPLT